MPSVIVVGAGLAGLAATAALADSGFEVDVFESRPYPGGRATSYVVPSADGRSEILDNCQHVLLQCCTNLLDFYRRMGVSDAIEFHDQFYFIEPGGEISHFQAGRLPAPAHFAESFLSLRFLNASEKLSLVEGLLALRRDGARRRDLDQITMLDWLRAHNQPARVVERFWRQILVSAVNEELDRMAASHGFQVISQGFLGGADSYRMGIPSVPLGELYNPARWRHLPDVRFHFRRSVEALDGLKPADYYLLAVPFERATAFLPELDLSAFEHSPITSVHLWFDRSVTDLPHGTLLDRTIQWMFNKGGGQHLQLVISASRSLVPMPRGEVIELAYRELIEFFPAVAEAKLLKAHVVKEVKATFSAGVGLEQKRPGPCTSRPNVFVAGDWTRTGWPATMEGAVRSGYLAAEAITASTGHPLRFLLPDGE